MDSKKIAILILIFAIICAAAFMIMTQHNSTQKNITSTNNTTNITKNTTNVTNVTNATPEEDSHQTSPESSASTHESDPEFGTDEYVDRWDESQKGDDSWAYTHDQPVKSEGGHDYKRMYNPDTEESYWYQMR